MNQQIKQAWIDALISGVYEQGESCLRDGDKFCCLGVLCDLAEQDGFDNWKDGYFSGRDGVLSEAVLQWAGLPLNVNVSVPFYSKGGKRSLSGINDSGASFEEIAELIHDHL